MPAPFKETYTPIGSAGTEQQISHLARLMASQMTEQNLGKGVEEMMRQAQIEMSQPQDNQVFQQMILLSIRYTQFIVLFMLQ